MYTFFLLLNTVIWGSTFFIIKGSVANIDPFMIVAGRSFVAVPVMFIVAYVYERNKIFEKAAIVRGAILGFLLATTYVSQTIGLKFTSSGHSAFITGAAVVMVPLLLRLYFKSRLSVVALVSVSIVTIGLFILSFDLETNINVGDAITLITALSYAHHLIFSGRFVKNTPLFTMVSYQFLFAGLFSGILYVFNDSSFVVPDSQGIYAILYLGLLGTLFCYFISIWVQRYVSATKVAVIFSLESVFAAFFGFIMLGEILSIPEAIGALLVLIGTIVYQKFSHDGKIV
ncbi:MAG: DMT family transporter [Fibrobacteres bacterium]|nr:DMT family transporter [Fibrobacterota bacterium]